MTSKLSCSRMQRFKAKSIYFLSVLLVIFVSGCSQEEEVFEDKYVMQSHLGKLPWKVIHSQLVTDTDRFSTYVIVESPKDKKRKTFYSKEILVEGDYITFEFVDSNSPPIAVKKDLGLVGPKTPNR